MKASNCQRCPVYYIKMGSIFFFSFYIRYDKRLEEENKQYNPFGRGGGGAPLKDSSGNILGMLFK